MIMIKYLKLLKEPLNCIENLEDLKFRYGHDYLTSGLAIKLARKEMEGYIDASTIKKIDLSAQHVESITKGNHAVYGINTGFGPLCSTTIQQDKLSQLQHNLLLSHSVGVGEALDDEVVKLMMVLKIHSLSKGYSGIRRKVIDRMIIMLEKDIIPVVPSQGSVGASGDLAPLAHMFLPLIGEGSIRCDDNIVNSEEILSTLGLGPLQLAPKEGLALINGTQFILAHAVLLVEKFYQILNYADFSAAMMIEGLKGSAAPFRKDLHDLRPFSGCQHVAHRLWSLIRGSEINNSHIGCNRVQDPYSLRCVPQVHGTSREAWLHLKKTSRGRAQFCNRQSHHSRVWRSNKWWQFSWTAPCFTFRLCYTGIIRNR
jgi:histidine ammonia-lyase